MPIDFLIQFRFDTGCASFRPNAGDWVVESDAPDSKTMLPWSSYFRGLHDRIPLRLLARKPIHGWHGALSDAPFISVDAVEKGLNVVPLEHAQLFFSELKPRLDCWVRVASGLRQCEIERRPFRRPLRIHIQADPVADLTIGRAVANHINEGIRRQSGGGHPPRIKALVKKVLLVVGMQLSPEVKANFVNQPGKINPPGHHLPGGSGENACAHGGKMHRGPRVGQYPLDPFCFDAAFSCGRKSERIESIT